MVRNDRGEYVLLRHADVRAAALDDATFSSAVSAHLQIPNGLDGDEHTSYRAALDPFLTAEALAPYEPEVTRPDAALQDRLRGGGSDAELDAVIDEVLRIDDPFVTNRRIITCPVTIGGVALPEGARVKLNWTSANRDEDVFGDPDSFDPAGHAPDNVVYGVGRHACPGRLLATIELRIAVRALLGATASVSLADGAERQVHPVGGWADGGVVLTPR